jgi:glycosyltransferase involved in cell wall biosynthesis
MFTGNPLVSIIIPVYNGSNYLREAIDSALAQTYSPCEIMVVNDGSNDKGKTEAVALSYGSRIKYFVKPNGGVATALNYGIRSMTGEFFSWLSHDDLYMPEKIQRQMDRLRSLPEDTIILSDYFFVNELSKAVGRVRLHISSNEGFRRLLVTNTSIHGCTLLLPKRSFDVVESFDETLQTTQDYHLWFLMSSRFRFVNIPEPLVCSRVHALQGSRTLPSMKVEANEFRSWAIRRIADDVGGRAACLALIRIALRFKILGYTAEASFAFACCRNVLATSPGSVRLIVSFLCLYYRFVPKKLLVGYILLFFASVVNRARIHLQGAKNDIGEQSLAFLRKARGPL